MTSDDFFLSIKRAVNLFWKNSGMVHVVSHMDTDGLCAGSLMVRALERLKIRYSLSIIQQLDNRSLVEFSNESYGLYVFCDLGSGHLAGIRKHLGEKSVIILDHHRPREAKLPMNIVHINPHQNGINGSEEISGAGVVYYFISRLDTGNELLAHIAVIGAIGDNQEHDGFKGFNKEILKMAQKSGSIVVTTGLRLFGAQSKPLNRVLENSFDPYIPGVTGNHAGVLKFISENGIELMSGRKYRKLVHLSKKELNILSKAITLRRKEHGIKGTVLGLIYTLPNEHEGVFRDAREFSTVLNACGRLGKSSIGIGALLGYPDMKTKAEKVLHTYRMEIMSALTWYEQNKQSKDIKIGNSYIIINAKDNIMPTMIGTIASIFSHSEDVKDGTVVITLGRLDDQTKISLRVSGKGATDLCKMLNEIFSRMKGEYGGHRFASGALIKTEDEQKFIQYAEEILKKYEITEFIGCA